MGVFWAAQAGAAGAHPQLVESGGDARSVAVPFARGTSCPVAKGHAQSVYLTK